MAQAPHADEITQHPERPHGSAPAISLTKETAMAKGQEKSNKEKKKPKADKNAPKSGGQSAYQQSKGDKDF